MYENDKCIIIVTGVKYLSSKQITYIVFFSCIYLHPINPLQTCNGNPFRKKHNIDNNINNNNKFNSRKSAASKMMINSYNFTESKPL